LKPAWTNSSRDPILKIPNTKRAGAVAQDIGPEFKPQYCKKKKKGHTSPKRSLEFNKEKTSSTGKTARHIQFYSRRLLSQ
jgi:hypothetical protein